MKTESVQKLRHMGETPILPGCYLRVTAKVKAVSGNLPSVRIAAWAGDASNAHVGGIDETGPSVALTAYGEIVEVTAIIGSGNRSGVDLVWGTAPAYAHVGLDLTGSNGGVVRVDDLVVEDVTNVFLRDLFGFVDVRDYGAIGDGAADDSAAFEAADAAANGRTVLVSEGTYKLGADVTFDNRVRFEGTVTAATDVMLILRQNYDYNTYLDAFGDEVLAFRKAWQALLNAPEHESLDLCGRRIELSAPVDMAAAVPNKSGYEIRRVVRNGQFNCVSGTGWDTEVVTSQASYSPNSPKKLTSVGNVANVPVGALVEGTGVGREVYVTEKNVGAEEVTLSQPLWGPDGNQTYTFRRFKYALDFSGFQKISKVTLDSIEFQCAGRGSAIMLAPIGETFHVKDCFITKPKDRGITSIGSGCQDLQIDRCHFTSDEQSLPVTERKSICFNVNANDSKIRDNRFQRFRHTAIMAGNGHLIVGNHWFNGDGVTNGPRLGGLILTEPNAKTIITGNYIDNNAVELTNEHDQHPDFANEYSFGGLTMTGNIFTCNDVASWFSWIVIKPYGTGHFIQGLSVTGNTFKSLNGSVARVETVDDTFAELDHFRTRNVIFEGNTFNGVDQPAINPVTLDFDQPSDAATWTLNVGDYLPFGGNARTVSSVVMRDAIRNGAGDKLYVMPTVNINAGADNSYVQLVWPEPCRGKVFVTARGDKPA
ncbi:glycosyl hydrolase family 28-related protein [Psychromarinibacter sp. C21-152]|uniref:Glycosyl hydrolase family 28-related protein n=1 Tax=Psychromarinibacter sediminicola TaxID=3033385 RepID=A0AAE3NXK3_9RHOB|nr:glycosyl hydrolase family 28-related protein [Psychromarinibacter sediminicola]MDF0603826.1 glycosyl hydrolase family 28-related protein [Psychromarinibacter sediminicola]